VLICKSGNLLMKVFEEQLLEKAFLTICKNAITA